MPLRPTSTSPKVSRPNSKESVRRSHSHSNELLPALHQLGDVVDAAIGHTFFTLTVLRDVASGSPSIAIEISELARLDRAGVEAERLGRIHGRRLQRIERPTCPPWCRP